MGRSGSSGALPSPQQGGPSSFGALLAAAEQRASASGPLLQDPVLEGSGIGRPISRNWKPPPIPAPTLSASSAASAGPSPSPSGAQPAAAPGPSGASAPAAPEPNGSGGEAPPRSPSASSLGADFASA